MINTPLLVKFISDIHLDFYQLHEIKSLALKFTDEHNTDLLVIAGDLGHVFKPNENLKIEKFLEEICQMYPKVFYVPGNHEYWNQKYLVVHSYFNKLEKQFSNLCVFSHRRIEKYKGKRFLGDPMFYVRHPKTKWKYDEEYWGDFTCNHPSVIYDHCKRTLEWLEKNVQKDDIIITHHAPSTMSIGARFIGNPDNKWFVCYDAEKIISDKQPALWVHGHMHNSFRYRIGKTLVYCNPYGYRNEINPQFDFIPMDI